MKRDRDGEQIEPREMVAMAEPQDLIRAMAFDTVSFYDQKQKRQIVLLYALGGDGIVREWNGQAWIAFPITRSNTVEARR